MSYTRKTIIDTEIARKEVELLTLGYTYAEIVELTRGRHKSIAERNRVIYKINIWDAFRKRIKREGIPNRLVVSDDFGYWFSGFVDGEGHFGFLVRYRHINERPSPDYASLFQIILRDDDADIIGIIKDNLRVGLIRPFYPSGNGNPAIAYRIQAQKDLAEVIIPLFDRYPLRTKKAKVYAIWRQAIIELYIRTLGGYSNRKAVTKEENTFFDNLAEQIKTVRAYSS